MAFHDPYAMDCVQSAIPAETRKPDASCDICAPIGLQLVGAITPGHLSTTRPIKDVPMPDKPPSILHEAEEIIHGDRRQAYGGALGSFDRIARLWEPIVGAQLTPEQVALCLVQLKVARAMHDVDKDRRIKRDTIVDIAGYAGCLEDIELEKYVQ